MGKLKSTFKIHSMTHDLEVPEEVRMADPYWPKTIFVVRADQITRTDQLCWSPKWTGINFVIPMGETKVQISTARYGMKILPAGMMVVVSRG